MSAYAHSLNDIDLGGFIRSATEGVTGAANELVTKAEAATKEAAAGVVRSGGDAVSQAFNKLVGGGGGATSTVPTSTVPALPATQSAETPVATTTPTAMSGLGHYAIPAAVGVGVYFWQKSILWAAGAAFATWWVAGRMRKGGR